MTEYTDSNLDLGLPIVYGLNWIRIQMQAFSREKKLSRFLGEIFLFLTFLLLRKKVFERR